MHTWQRSPNVALALTSNLCARAHRLKNHCARAYAHQKIMRASSILRSLAIFQKYAKNGILAKQLQKLLSF
jgi:flagellin-specific chaperone FliS